MARLRIDLFEVSGVRSMDLTIGDWKTENINDEPTMAELSNFLNDSMVLFGEETYVGENTANYFKELVCNAI